MYDRFKFRAWHKGYSDKNIKPIMLHDRIIGNCLGFKNQGQPVELMQCIGRKDKTGKLIFEGDIIDVSMSWNGKTLPHRGEIVFNKDFASFATKNEGGVTLLHNHCLHTAEIIGNIYENPELIKQQPKETK